jgi:hypothetical protein
LLIDYLRREQRGGVRQFRRETWKRQHSGRCGTNSDHGCYSCESRKRVHHVGVVESSRVDLLEMWTATGRCISCLLSIRMSVKGCDCHETVSILTLLPGMTEAESARLHFSCHLTTELGKSTFSSGNIVLMQLSVSVTRSM